MTALETNTFFHAVLKLDKLYYIPAVYFTKGTGKETGSNQELLLLNLDYT